MQCSIPSSLCLTDSELVMKLLALDLKATTAKMLETCRIHKAIADNLHAYGPQIQNCQCCQHMELMISVLPPQQQKTLRPQNQHACGNCTKSHAPGRASCPAKGLHMLILWHNWSLGCQMPKHLQ